MNSLNGLPPSARRYQEQQTQEQVERENREKFQSAWNDVRHFTSDKPDENFYSDWARRILTFADSLKSEGLAEFLDDLDSQAESELVRDGFRFGLKIYRAALDGNESEVVTLLKTTATAPQVFIQVVGNAIRREIVEMLQAAKWPERFAANNVHLTKPKTPKENSEGYTGEGSDGTANKNGEAVQANDDSSMIRLVSLFTGGVADEKIKQAEEVRLKNGLNVNEKLWAIDKIIPIPPTASARQLADTFGVSKTAVVKTEWWRVNRSGKKSEEVENRKNDYKQRSKTIE